MRHTIVPLVSFVLASAVACGAPPPTKGAPVDERAKLLAKPANGFTAQMPTAHVIPGGGDQQLCWVPAVPASAAASDQLVVNVDGAQGSGGHHIFVFQSEIPRKAGEEFDCTGMDQMATLLPFLVSRTPNIPSTGKIMPEGYAVRMKAGVTLVVQSHYVNVKPEPILVQDNVAVSFADDPASVTEAAYYAQNVDSFDIPPGVHAITESCTMQGDLPALTLLGHMHEWGKSFSYTITPAGGAESTLYTVPEWNASFRDNAPVTIYPVGQPLVIHDGDTLTLHCQYNNDTGKNLAFPDEMCAVFGAYAPARADGFVVCGGGSAIID
jgi:hypothetical protein